MIDPRSSLGIAILMLLLAPGASRAQEPVHSFEELRQHVAVGQRVIVTDAQGRQVRGRLSEISASALALTVHDTRREFLEAEIERVSRRDSRWNGTLLGAAAAGALAAWIDRALVDEYGREDVSVGESVTFIAQAAAVGAGIGFAVDTLIKGQRILYSRSASSARSRSMVSSVWLGHRAGIFVSVPLR